MGSPERISQFRIGMSGNELEDSLARRIFLRFEVGLSMPKNTSPPLIKRQCQRNLRSGLAAHPLPFRHQFQGGFLENHQVFSHGDCPRSGESRVTATHERGNAV